MDQVGAKIGDEPGHAGAGVAVVDDAGHAGGLGQQATAGVMGHMGEKAGLGGVQPFLGAGEPRDLMAIGLEHPADLVIEDLGPAEDRIVVMGEENAHLPLFLSEARPRNLKKRITGNC